MTGGTVNKKVNEAKRGLKKMRKMLGKTGKGVVAGLTGAALAVSGFGKSVKDRAVDIKDSALNHKKKSGEVIEMKKSTLVAVLVALAAVAGVLAALYFYVLRRERELDEYEQLLFSEDFNDDLIEDDEEPLPEQA